MTDAMEVIQTRRSIREYENRPIARETLEAIVNAARLAPSAVNQQPWEFVVVTRRETLKALSTLCKYGPFIADAAACIVVLLRPSTRWIVHDGSAAAAIITLAAWNYGIGSCWVAFNMPENLERLRETLHIQDGLECLCMIPLGYPAASALSFPRAPKRSLDEVLHWERM